MLTIAFSYREKSSTNESTYPILGLWLKPIDGMKGFDSIEMKEGGVASSINSSTLLYETWA